MTDWWSYRPSDFLMFSPRTYWRLLEAYNAAWWPAHLVALGLGLLVLALVLRRQAVVPVILVAVAWAAVAESFHLQRYAAINTAAPVFAAAFLLQAGLLVAAGAARPAASPAAGAAVLMGLGLAYPAVGLLAGRPLAQAELPGLSPDPTALLTLGLLLALRPPQPATRWQRTLNAMAWPVPLLWCLGSGLTLWNLQAADAFVLPLAAVIAAGLRLRS